MNFKNAFETSFLTEKPRQSRRRCENLAANSQFFFELQASNLLVCCQELLLLVLTRGEQQNFAAVPGGRACGKNIELKPSHHRGEAILGEAEM
jgi:hypothetical protein